eukprot:TRINITY_DN74355_c0_g1_i1.p1 TRINITY_DN74355_c0_g1~~TRINITY_DN74355_c0_g1_i1.p1  ORF type:complete len:380 (+),score=54.21 TRINITY_DN74355_c0_g1_i1:54-1142(+)
MDVLAERLPIDGACSYSSESESSSARHNSKKRRKKSRRSNFASIPRKDEEVPADSSNMSAEAMLDQMVAIAKAGAKPTEPSPAPTPASGGPSEPLRPIPPPPGTDPARWKTILCAFYQEGGCRKGRADCAFAHGPEDLAQQASREVASARVDFASGADVNRVVKTYTIPSRQKSAMLSNNVKSVLVEVSGINDLHFDSTTGKVTVAGTAVQVEKAGVLLQRASTHCHWGISEAKVMAILRPPSNCTSARCTLSPMVPTLNRCTVTLTSGRPTLTIGTDPGNALVVRGPNLSRAHAALEFVPGRGVVYVCDTSTNGTFLNGRRLPGKGQAKVVIWHGDELLLQDPKAPGQSGEFGYMVNLEVG